MTTRVQLNALVKNKATELNLSPGIVLRMTLFDLFLEKLAQSEYCHQFVIKGGFLIAAITQIELRTTKDLDVTIKSLALNHQVIESVFQHILSIPTIANLHMNLIKLETILEEATYQGLRATIQVAFDGLVETIKIDLTAGDVITPHEIDFHYQTLIKGKKLHLKSYNVETILSEKLETILMRAQVNTRMRDFYDVFILWSRFQASIQLDMLKKGFIKTSTQRGSLTTIEQNVADILKMIKTDPQLNQLWKQYQSAYEFAQQITWKKVLLTVEHIIFNLIFN